MKSGDTSLHLSIGNPEENKCGFYATTIEGITPGEVSYVITIPEEVSFGNLTQPENSIDDSYKYCNFQVEATELNNFEKNDAVDVYLKDGSESNDVYFYLAQEGGSYSFVYDIYDCAVNDDNIADNTPINNESNAETGDTIYADVIIILFLIVIAQLVIFFCNDKHGLKKEKQND
ncbi:MAG: hypothetical protein Q4E74_08985 [Ruminococcus sp.]|nr:hypothetical protein [Ruminococcus sp.]